jgi:hypothetical protein
VPGDAALPYARSLIADLLDRTKRAMSQAHCFKVSRSARLRTVAGDDGAPIEALAFLALQDIQLVGLAVKMGWRPVRRADSS